jgi:DNA end-binding protein Ku
MVRPVSDDKLMLHVLYYADEVRAFDEVPAGKAANDRELQLATHLIRHLQTRKWDPSRYHDTYRERVLALIKKKQAGETIVAPKTPRGAWQGRGSDDRAETKP